MGFVRLLAYLLFIYLGYQAGSLVDALASSAGALSLNRIYLAVVGLLVGFLLVPRLTYTLEWAFVRMQERIKALPPEVPVALTVASTIGLLLSVLLTSLLSQWEGFSPVLSLVLAGILITLLSAVALANREYFKPRQPVSPQPGLRSRGGKLLDTSILIDGRVAEVVELGFLEGPLYVPQFILRELQYHADASDAQRRAKGRRGLETLERLKNSTTLEVIEESAKNDDPVDDQLLALARRMGSALVTNDHALLQLARIYGVKALSVQALAAALRSPHAAGESLRITIVKEGKEPGQGVGYLEDGTMIVVDDALAYRGQEVQVTITQSIQTQVGRLLFAKLDRTTT